MLKNIIITSIFLSMSGCSSVSSEHQFENTMRSAKSNVEKRESTLPNDFKTGHGNSDDVEKGVKHSINESLFFLFLSLFSDE